VIELDPPSLRYRATGEISQVLLTATGPTGTVTAIGAHDKFITIGQLVVLRAAPGGGGDDPPPPPPPPPPPVDETAPSVPGGVVASVVSSTRVDVSWGASTDDTGVVSYTLRRGGAVVATQASRSFSDTSLVAGTTYSYTVSAADAAGNSSALSAPVQVTTAPAPPPPPPGSGVELRDVVSGHSAQEESMDLVLPMPQLVAGDVLLATLTVRGNPSITAPAGWSLVRQDAGERSLRRATYVRVATAQEPASATWSFSKMSSAAGAVMSYSGVSTSSPVEAHSGQFNDSPSEEIDVPSVTASAGSMLVGLFSVPASSGITEPAGMTEVIELDPPSLRYRATGEVSQVLLTATGPTGTVTAIGAHDKFITIGQLVVLRAAG